jgi:hypothetical protein
MKAKRLKAEEMTTLRSRALRWYGLFLMFLVFLVLSAGFVFGACWLGGGW